MRNSAGSDGSYKPQWNLGLLFTFLPVKRNEYVIAFSAACCDSVGLCTSICISVWSPAYSPSIFRSHISRTLYVFCSILTSLWPFTVEGWLRRVAEGNWWSQSRLALERSQKENRFGFTLQSRGQFLAPRRILPQLHPQTQRRKLFH